MATGRAERMRYASAPEAALAAAGEAAMFVVLFEATGPLRPGLHDALQAAQMRFARVNPAQRARAFARAAGFLPRPRPSMPGCWP